MRVRAEPLAVALALVVMSMCPAIFLTLNFPPAEDLQDILAKVILEGAHGAALAILFLHFMRWRLRQLRKHRDELLRQLGRM